MPQLPEFPSWTTPDPRGNVDLHLHTTASDGSETPRRLFELAAEKGLKAIGFCDHDTVSAAREGFALAEEFGIEFVPGCEIGIAHDPDRGLVETDLLAYYYDPDHDELNDVLSRLRAAKNEKLDAQLGVLEREGFQVPRNEILAEARGETIRRPHIFAVLRRYYPDLDPQTFYPNTDFGGPWYVSKSFSLGLEECVAVVRRAGGVTVLSSPGSYNTLYKKTGALIDPQVDDMIRVCAQAGVDCLETVYSYDCNKPYFRSTAETITPHELGVLIQHYEDLAEALALTKTGGSDFHGASKPQIAMGSIPVGYRYLEGLRRAAGRSPRS
jgi:3',5'-nucleoside bisphosphate phosphatase